MVGTPHADESSNVDIPLQSRPRPSPRSSTPVPDDSRGNYPTPAAPVHSTAAVMLHDNSSIHTLVDDTPPPTRIKDPDDVEAVKNFNSRPSIEFAPTEDDPRLWSDMKKNLVLGIVAGSSMCGIIAGNIFFPAITSLQADLDANDTLVAASVSLFILCQGLFPILWAGISEISGRKRAYIASLTIFCGATAACATAKSIGAFLVSRVFQACGSSAVLALGAGTLVDIYQVHERGTKLGIYYAVPLLGPSLGPIIGGAITSRGSWIDTFWFLFAYGFVCLVAVIFLPETWRKERSVAWTQAAKRAETKAELLEEKTARYNFEEFSPEATHVSPTPAQLEYGLDPTHKAPTFDALRSVLSTKPPEKPAVRVSLRDANPVPAMLAIFSSPHNSLAIASSAILFASQYCISFTSSRAFAAPPYEFSSLIVGVILLVYGIGNVMGSIGGGRLSDRALRLMKEANGGIGQPEMRLRSVVIPMFILPPFFVVYAWLVDRSQTIYSVGVVLFILGAATIWIYSGTLSYVVDANPGMASMAVAGNSLLRGIFAATASQAADPLIKLVGTGFFYTGFAVIILVGEVLLIVVSRYGEGWRETNFEKTFEKETKEAMRISNLHKRRNSDATICGVAPRGEK